MSEADLKIHALLARMNGVPTLEADINTLFDERDACRQFALAVLDEAREELGDVGGDFIEEQALKAGLLEAVEATEPCCLDPVESCCRCEEYGFPVTCYRYTKLGGKDDGPGTRKEAG